MHIVFHNSLSSKEGRNLVNYEGCYRGKSTHDLECAELVALCRKLRLCARSRRPCPDSANVLLSELLKFWHWAVGRIWIKKFFFIETCNYEAYNKLKLSL